MKTIREVFSANLRRLRGARTQAEMVEAAEIPFVSYQRAENGDIPQRPNLEALAKAHGVPETVFFQDPDLLTPQNPLDLVLTRLDRIEARLSPPTPQALRPKLVTSPPTSLLGEAVRILAGLDEHELRTVMPYIEAAREMGAVTRPDKDENLTDHSG